MTDLSAKIHTAEQHVLGKGLPAWCWKHLQTCPASGAGIHRWLPGAALRVLRYASTDETVELLNLAARGGCATAAQLREIQDAVWWAQKRLCQEETTYDAESYYVEPNVGDIREIGASGGGLEGLKARTPVAPDLSTEQFVDALFPADSLLCVAGEQYDAITAVRPLLRGYLEDLQFIVPSPMSAVTGWTQNGAVSERCLANTGKRRFLVTEFDLGPDTLDIQANLIWHLKELEMPLSLVLWSGSKSLHAWWFVEGQSEDPDDGTSLFHFFRYATHLGADRVTWLRCQFVRLPEGWNKRTQRRQTVHYFDPGRVI